MTSRRQNDWSPSVTGTSWETYEASMAFAMQCSGFLHLFESSNDDNVTYDCLAKWAEASLRTDHEKLNNYVN